MFIDEISMVGSGLFNLINLCLQQIMGTQSPFSGINLVTVGDLFQLQPVFDRWIFETPSSAYAPLATNVWLEYFKMHELTEIMRQKDNREFAEILNHLSEGNHTAHDIKILKKRVVQINGEQNNELKNKKHLFVTNKRVRAHNLAVFNEIKLK